MSKPWKIPGVPDIAPTFVQDPKSTALLIVDMQYAGTHPGYGSGGFMKTTYPEVYAYYFSRVDETVIPNTRKLLTFFREQDLRIIFLGMGSQLPDGSDLTKARRQRTSVGKRWAGSEDFRIREEIAPEPGELFLLKTAANPFNSSMIDQTLRNMEIESLVIAGVVTNACVELTARDGADRGYQTVVVEDACAAWAPELHEAALRTFATMHGDVVTTDELIADFAAKLTAAGG